MAEFDDHKDAGALRTIGEVGKALGIKAHVLRYWEEQFVQLKPVKRAGGRRLYRPEDVALIERIDRLVNREGYTLKGARAALKTAEAPEPDAPPSALPDDLIPKLKAIRAELASALEAV
ncbi:MerR family transcriptional regulator [Qipengyuania sp.]|uniref:MerR family transcriptional regulator n=1 Tax=Qipengyuania sp. TaxID=2004515 RepID=UPI0035C83370